MPARSGFHWPTFAVPVVAGVLVVVLAWFAGPGLLGIKPDDAGAPVRAEVTRPTPCDHPDPVEAVKFTLGGKTREGTLNGCGHGQGEHLEVGVPIDAPSEGVITVRAADTSAGAQDARRPIGLALLVFACFSGAMFVHLVQRPVPPKPANVS